MNRRIGAQVAIGLAMAAALARAGTVAAPVARAERVHAPDTVPRADSYTAKRKAEKAKRKGNKKGFRK